MLFANLGTPDGYDYWSMRRYLSEFLSDKRVIDYPAWKWQPILQLIILTRRPKAKGHDYKSIWNHEKNESPLLTITREQVVKLRAAIQAEYGADVMVDFCMRYGNPSVEEKLTAMKAAGCDRILIAPLYPQYSGATTATGFDEVARVLGKMRWQPALRTLPAYHDDPAYIGALKASVEAGLRDLPFTPDAVLASFHSMPERTLHLGDPYHCHCQKTTRLVREQLGWPQDRMMVCFQSRFGSEEWLQPYLDKTIDRKSVV